MKSKRNLKGFIAILLLISVTIVNAQKPQSFNYQAVARDSEGNTIKEARISVVLAIQDKGGKVLWEEAHDLTTSPQGLFSIAIGASKEAVTEQLVEQLSDLPWASEELFLNIRLNDNDMGTEIIQSVPMAMYGKDEDSDPANEVQDLTLNNGLLSITRNNAASNIDLRGFVNTEMAWQKGESSILYPSGNVGVGTSSPEAIMDVVGPVEQIDTVPIFQVKNHDNIPVFAVYNDGVRIYIPDDVEAKGPKGGFAVGGYNNTKGSLSEDYFLQVMPQGANINFFTETGAKGSGSDPKATGLRGGFAVGGYNNTSKSDQSSYIYMDPYAVPMTNDGGYLIILPLFDALNEKGNCYLGTLAGQNREGHFNTSIGYQSGYSINSGFTGSTVLFPTNASYNTTLGAFSGFSNIYGDKNVYLGYQSGYLNEGNGNVFIGYQSGAAYTSSSNLLIIDNEETTNPLLVGNFDTDYLETNANFVVDNGYFKIADNPGTGTSPAFYAFQGSAESVSKQFAFTINDYLWVTQGAVFDGTIYVNGTTYSSDARYKSQVESISDGLDLVKQLEGVYFEWKTEEFDNKGFEEGRQLGLIAQDVESVLPEVVETNDDGYKSIDYAKLVAVLIEAVKEQQLLIDEQRVEIDALKTEELSTEELQRSILDMQATILELSSKIASMERYTER